MQWQGGKYRLEVDGGPTKTKFGSQEGGGSGDPLGPQLTRLIKTTKTQWK